jgi:electron-transferring-flavoprotein dehydrogenase
VRNFHQGFDGGLWLGLANGALQMISGGRGLKDPMPTEPGHQRMKKIENRELRIEDRHDTRAVSILDPRSSICFDKLTDVYYSQTSHEENQPCHLLISDPDICTRRCTIEYGNPCQFFCPANVYEIVAEAGAKRLQINASNCVHCKTCDIMDPYQIITWVPPEGGGGPDWRTM